MDEHRNDGWTLAAFIFTVLMGGLNIIGVHYVEQELAPFWAATLRFAPAAAILFLLALILKLPLPRGKALLAVIGFGVLNFGASYAFIYFGMKEVQPGMGQVILALTPVFTLLFATLHRQERFRWRVLLGALLALGGIAVVFWEQLGTQVSLDCLLALLLGGVCLAESTVIAKGLPVSHPITTASIGMASGSAALFLVSLVTGEKHNLPLRANTWLALTYLIIISSCTVFTLILFILKRWPASTLSYQFVLFPFVTLAVSSLMAGEELQPLLLVGAALVLAGVFTGIVRLPRRLKPVPPARVEAGKSAAGAPSDCPDGPVSPLPADT